MSLQGNWHCDLCSSPLFGGIEAVLDHMERYHPLEYGDGPTRWPDGGLVIDKSAVAAPEDFAEEV